MVPKDVIPEDRVPYLGRWGIWVTFAAKESTLLLWRDLGHAEGGTISLKRNLQTSIALSVQVVKASNPPVKLSMEALNPDPGSI